MNSLRALAALILFLPLGITAGWIDREGNKLPDTHDQKAIGDFGAWLLLTGNVEQAFKNWNTPSETVHIDTENKFKRNEYVSALVVFSGCGEDEIGNCNVAVKFKVLNPNGSIYADLPLQEAWIGKPSPGKALQMSIGYIMVKIEDHEPIGTYEIEVNVLDLNLKQNLSLSSQFHVSE